jgi:chromosome segregation ATPase
MEDFNKSNSIFSNLEQLKTENLKISEDKKLVINHQNQQLSSLSILNRQVTEFHDLIPKTEQNIETIKTELQQLQEDAARFSNEFEKQNQKIIPIRESLNAAINETAVLDKDYAKCHEAAQSCQNQKRDLENRLTEMRQQLETAQIKNAKKAEISRREHQTQIIGITRFDFTQNGNQGSAFA